MRAANAVRFAFTGVIALTAAAGVTGSWERDPRCVIPLSNDINDRVERWHRSVNTGNSAAITDVYSPDAILMGIGENAIRLGRREIADHYMALLRDRMTVTLLSRVIEADCGTAIVTGLQRFDRLKESHVSTAEAAYKMMFAYGDGAWLLIHHHLAPLSDFVGRDLSSDVAGVSLVETGTVKTATVTTGTAKTRATTLGMASEPLPTVSLPPPAFQLSPAPPVFMPTQLPHVLSSRRPGDLRVPVVVTVPPLGIDTGRFPEIAKLATPEPVVVFAVPALQINIGKLPIVAGTPKAVDPIGVAPATLAPEPPVSVPKLAFDIGAFPLTAEKASTPELPAARVIVSTKAVPEAVPPSSPRPAPAVASFAQRAATAARPPVAVGGTPKPSKAQPSAPRPASATPAKSAQSGSSYRPVSRWDDKLPVFEAD